jgi:spermidine synthase
MSVVYTFTFSAALLLSSALLLLVQPLLGKLLLPSLGGAPVVWNTCLLFFQTALLAGYAYAHASTCLLGARRQALLHVLVFLIPGALYVLGTVGVLWPMLPFRVEGWLPAPGADPILATLALLLTVIGLPFIIVSATAPLLQRWFGASGHPAGNDPYFLYAAANVGSMAALVSYPLWLEPRLQLDHQSGLWLAGYAALGGLVLVCVLLLWISPSVFTARVVAARPASADAAPLGRPTWLRRLRWLVLSAVPVSLLLGLTTALTTDVPPVPVFWVIPLALYLVSFILAFAPRSSVHRLGLPPAAFLVAQVIYGVLIVALFVTLVVLRPAGNAAWYIGGALAVLLTLMPFRLTVVLQPLVTLGLIYVLVSEVWQVSNLPAATALNLLTFYVTARVCHGTLAGDRPAGPFLTEFFLWVAAGGALGGVFNVLLAPLLFRRALVEYPLALVAACLLRPAWLANGLTDWVLATMPEGSGKRSQPARQAQRRTLAWVFDLGLGLGITGLTFFYLEVISGQIFRDAISRNTNTPWTAVTFFTFGVPLLLCLVVVARPVRFGLALAGVLLALVFSGPADRSDDALLVRRTPFGLVRVIRGTEWQPVPDREVDGHGDYNSLRQGTTLQGLNYRSASRRRQATTYYSSSGPAGLALKKFDWFGGPENRYAADARLPASLIAAGAGIGPVPLEQLACLYTEPPIAVVGLGVGTMASYARPYQYIDYYELDPAVVELSLPTGRTPTYFSYLADARARGSIVKVAVGDGRLLMEREAPDGFYQRIYLDGLNSDAFPVHLLTREAFQTYLAKLAPDGIICVHTSNRHVDLVPVLADLAENLGLACRRGHDVGTTVASSAHTSSEWVLLARSRRLLAELPEPEREPDAARDRFGAPELFWTEPAGPGRPVWTDNYTNLAGALRYGASSDVFRLVEGVLVGLGVVLLLWVLAEAVLLGVLGEPSAPPKPVVRRVSPEAPPWPREHY